MKTLVSLSKERIISTFLRKTWFSAIKQPSDLLFFSSRSFPPEIKQDPHFVISLMYVCHLFKGVEQMDFSTYVLEDTQKECTFFEREGKLCVFLSTLLYGLLLHHEVCHDRQLKYVQGYFWHKARTDTYLGGLLGDVHMGTHAWLSVEQAVLDVSIQQEKHFFDLHDYPFLLGEVPSGLYLKGFAEPKKTVMAHLESFASRQNLSYSEWIKRHATQAQSYFTTYQNHA